MFNSRLTWWELGPFCGEHEAAKVGLRTYFSYANGEEFFGCAVGCFVTVHGGAHAFEEERLEVQKDHEKVLGWRRKSEREVHDLISLRSPAKETEEELG